MFKVVPDQLRISDGWVRCGQCDEVFDANAQLTSDPLVDDEPEEDRSPVEAFSPDPDWAASLKFTPEEKTDIRAEPDIPVGKVEPSLEHLAQDAAPIDDFLMQSPKALAQPSGADSEAPPQGAAADPYFGEVSSAEPRYLQADKPSLEATHAADGEPLSFMRPAASAGVWRRTGVRIFLSLMALALSALFFLQIAVQERDHWAAFEPTTRPYLNLLCEAVSCTVEPLRDIEAVVIDGSSFSKLGPDMYRLHVAIKNNGTVPLAPPALELTLTDLQDQSLLRRVFLAQDLGFKGPTLMPGTDFHLNVPIAVKPGNAAERISGYRLLAFYP